MLRIGVRNTTTKEMLMREIAAKSKETKWQRACIPKCSLVMALADYAPIPRKEKHFENF